ncbi:viral A-type inclusion protein repeat-containing domain protein [Teladorsagia circumcincta]|uniref:Viral A-type inclusion protein repeat-containing domain protein n=1 Tax=Teladorsagia circumcincta TaxID=45464 RepID=A0A2G9V732_TELCI|nr:viral A-type inclusion protein repeat-containing domain protein [Teladorsagia circumcincta]
MNSEGNNSYRESFGKEEEEAARLLDELRNAQEELSRRRSSSVENRGEQWRSGSSPPGQTYPNVEMEQLRIRAAEQDAEITRLRAEAAQISALKEELEMVKRKSAEATEELDAIRCTNFELMTKAETLTSNLKTTEEEKEGLREMYEKTCTTLEQKEAEEATRNEKEAAVEEELKKTREELERAQEKSEELERELSAVRAQLTEAEASLASQRVDMGETQDRINRMEEELFAARSELDNARFGLQETTAVKKELEHLKEEVQHLEYITAFEEKITCLEKELQEAKAKMEQDKAEKKKLKAALKQIRDREKSRSELSEVQQQSVTEVRQSVVLLEPLQTTAPSESPSSEKSQPQAEVDLDHLKMALKAQITSLHGESEHFEMELKLHEMLEAELEKELSDARMKNQQLTEAMQHHEESLEMLSGRASSDAGKNEESIHELMAEVRELREHNVMLQQQLEVAEDKVAREENLLAQEREHFSEIDKAHSEEVRELSITLADARRTISDMEVRLSEAENNFDESQSLVTELKNALDEKSREMAQLHRELTRLREAELVQQTALLRAPSTTSEIVASVLVGETESVRLDASQEAVPEPAEVKTTQEAPSTAVTAESSPAETDEDTRGATVPSGNDLFAENLILRQCINETNQMQNDLTQVEITDVEKMWQLKTELENAVEALKGEIWSLNGQLKASILDREQLQDRVVELDSSLAAEKKRADALDCELSEQTELTEKASRQAAEAENESNRRLAECLEMETRREQVEKAYAQLSEYYSQLQAAYNVIYAKLKQIETEKAVVEKEQQELQLDVDSELSLHGKVLLIQKALREKLAEVS